jgi:zinc-ribbon domain
MAGFCRNCGSPLDDGQGFCARCGTATSGPLVRPSASPSAPPFSAPRSQTPPQAAPQPRPPAAAPSKSGSTLVKVLLVFLVVIFFFGAVGVAGIWYAAHRVNQKAHEIGLDDLSTTANANRGPALGGIDPCNLLSKADVGQAAKVEVIRAEANEGSEPGCVYNVQGDISDLVAKHASLLHKEATTQAQRQQFESIAKNLFQGMNAEQSASTSKHPGEAPVFTFSVSNAGARAQMNLSRMAFSRLGGGMVTLPDLGDDNLDIGGAMMLVRKGDKLIRVMYMMCPCNTDDVTPLVKKLIANM